MRKLYFISIAFSLVIIVFNSCEKESFKYEGTWEGTTSQDLPISIDVGGNSFDLYYSIRLSVPESHEESCGRGGCWIDGNVSEVELSSLNCRYCEAKFYTKLHLTFLSSNNAKGKIDSYEGQYSYISGSTYYVSTTTYFPDITFTLNKK
jgi:hypothetical protein